ncbi:MAG: polysaccharide deacetylase family protein, partial [Pseudomonadota bacterium]|nr:polysaccharide deacetylase family protein [Pseudomonadota bacterium]
EFEAWLAQRARGGDEIALHGWSHRDELPSTGLVDHLRRNHYTRGEGEFLALTETEARARIEQGLAWFHRHGWHAHGFVAPAWLLGEASWRALDGHGFAYTATLGELIHLPGHEPVVSQSVVYSTSSAWRRQASLIWNRIVAVKERRNRLLRIELHPRDADFAGILGSWQRILEQALRDRRAMTVAEFMRQSAKQSARVDEPRRPTPPRTPIRTREG